MQPLSKFESQNKKLQLPYTVYFAALSNALMFTIFHKIIT